jgi:hypothetical protein
MMVAAFFVPLVIIRGVSDGHIGLYEKMCGNNENQLKSACHKR